MYVKVPPAGSRATAVSMTSPPGATVVGSAVAVTVSSSVTSTVALASAGAFSSSYTVTRIDTEAGKSGAVHVTLGVSDAANPGCSGAGRMTRPTCTPTAERLPDRARVPNSESSQA